MGRIKSALVKRTARHLVQEDLEFNTSFENNKKMLGLTMPSKKMRNKIAGYIGRLKKQQKEESKN